MRAAQGRGVPSWGRAIGGTALVVLLLALPNATARLPAGGAAAGPASSLPTMAAFDAKIKHIVILMMENHAYDNYYGTYCTHLGPYCSMKADGIPPGTCVPKYPANLSRGCIVPFTFTSANWSIQAPLPHSSNSSLAAYANGSMDGFYQAEGSGIDPFGHYTGASAPILWDLAEEYSLGDMFFSSTMSSSLPNHWHLVAGQAPPAIQNTSFVTQYAVHATNRSLYLDEANKTVAIEDLLANSTVSWRWYDHPIANNYTDAIRSTAANGPTGSALYLWDPMAAKAESYNASFRGHFQSQTNFYSVAANGTLPAISWIIPPGVDSDHPPVSSGRAQGWIASIVNAVELSPEWNSTALFITYDEYGGFYDHVAPPIAPGTTNVRLGFRVPFLVISPYARENFVSNATGDFESLLHLVELRFHLGCLTAMDCNAPSLLQYFHFNQPPRPPIVFPNSTGNASYPMPLQNATNFATWPGYAYVPPLSDVYFPQGEGPDID